MQYFIDTNIFLRVLIKENEKSFNDCFNLLNLIRQKKIKAFTSSLILSEIVWTLLSFYKFSKNRIIKVLKGILNLRGLRFIDDFNSKLALDFYQSHNIKFIDALITSISKINKKAMTIVSYDRDFDKLKIIRKEPKEILKNFTS